MEANEQTEKIVNEVVEKAKEQFNNSSSSYLGNVRYY